MSVKIVLAGCITYCIVFSFHVGSGCYDATAYSEAVISAKEVFAMADTAGYRFSLLDIGGGFPGPASAKPSFDEVESVKHIASVFW